jgi:hypothetical protein
MEFLWNNLRLMTGAGQLNSRTNRRYIYNLNDVGAIKKKYYSRIYMYIWHRISKYKSENQICYIIWRLVNYTISAHRLTTEGTASMVGLKRFVGHEFTSDLRPLALAPLFCLFLLSYAFFAPAAAQTPASSAGIRKEQFPTVRIAFAGSMAAGQTMGAGSDLAAAAAASSARAGSRAELVRSAEAGI